MLDFISLVFNKPCIHYWHVREILKFPLGILFNSWIVWPCTLKVSVVCNLLVVVLCLDIECSMILSSLAEIVPGYFRPSYYFIKSFKGFLCVWGQISVNSIGPSLLSMALILIIPIITSIACFLCQYLKKIIWILLV